MAEYWGFDQVDVNGLVFTSYNSLDWKRIAPIAIELRKMGVPVWYDYGLEAGTDAWGTQISIHIDKSNALIIFITKGIFEREKSYVIEEYKEAERLDIPVLPVFLDDVTDKGYYKTIDPKYRRYVNFWDDLQGVAFQEGASALTIAQTIKLKLDQSSQIKYKPVPWVEKQSDREKKANEAKQKADQEALADKEKHAVTPKIVNASDRYDDLERINLEISLRLDGESLSEPEEHKVQESKNVFLKKDFAVGDVVDFGTYPQSSNDPTPIAWRVLAVDGSGVLMISEKLLDACRYDVNSNNWMDSELRKWLNDTFMQKAFSLKERNRLLLSAYKDKVTCLSVEEIDRCLSSKKTKQNGIVFDTNRTGIPTAYAKKNGAYVDPVLGTGSWWLRSSGNEKDKTAFVDCHGSIIPSGFVYYSRISVRPVIQIKL